MAQRILLSITGLKAASPSSQCGRNGAWAPVPVRVQAAFAPRLRLTGPALHSGPGSRDAGCRAAAAAAQPEAAVEGMTAFLDSLKWDKNGLVVAIAQHVDTGEVLMQAFADRAAVCETLQTG